MSGICSAHIGFNVTCLSCLYSELTMTKQYLADANRGAQRNAEVNRLLVQKNITNEGRYNACHSELVRAENELAACRRECERLKDEIRRMKNET